MKGLQKVGGYAAVIQGLAFVALLLIFFVVLPGQGFAFPKDVSNPDKSLPLASTLGITNLFDLVFSATVVLIVLALRDRLHAATASRMRLAVIAASVASALFLAHGMFGFTGGLALANVYVQNRAAAAAAFLPFGLVLGGLQSGAIFAAGWSVLLWGWAALQTSELPRPLTYVVLLAGIVAVLQFLQNVLGFPIGLLGVVINVVWSLWLGVVLLREPARMPAPARKPA